MLKNEVRKLKRESRLVKVGERLRKKEGNKKLYERKRGSKARYEENK